MRAALLALLLTTAPALAGDRPPSVIGQGVVEAQKRLHAAGWSNGPTGADPQRCGIGWEDICADPRFTMEVLTCRGTGRAGCTFVFTQDSKGKESPILMVETQGEEIQAQRVVRAHILSQREERDLFEKLR